MILERTRGAFCHVVVVVLLLLLLTCSNRAEYWRETHRCWACQRACVKRAFYCDSSAWPDWSVVYRLGADRLSRRRSFCSPKRVLRPIVWPIRAALICRIRWLHGYLSLLSLSTTTNLEVAASATCYCSSNEWCHDSVFVGLRDTPIEIAIIGCSGLSPPYYLNLK